MKLDIFNNIINNIKENTTTKNFINELTNYLEKKNNQMTHNSTDNNNITNNNLKQENNLYQVVDIGAEGVYLQNVTNNKISKEENMPKDLIEKIGNDTVLIYKDGKYVIDEELTQKFLDNLVGIKEYETIQNNFEKESKILENDENTKYKIEEKQEKYSTLSYEKNGRKIIKAPNELIPFWAKQGENIYYKDGEFHRHVV